MEELIGVGHLARRFGIRASAVRYYEDRGLLIPHSRDSAGRRRYGPEQIRRLVFLRMCQDAALTLDEIAVVSDGDSADDRSWREVARRRIRDLDRQIAGATSAREFLTNSLRCPCDHPALECPVVQRLLDERLAAAS